MPTATTVSAVYDTDIEYNDLEAIYHLVSRFGTHFHVKASRVGWRNLSGEAACTLEPDDVLGFIQCVSGYELGVSMKIRFAGEDEKLWATVYTHDSPTGEHRELVPGWYCQGCGEVIANEIKPALLNGDKFCPACAFSLSYKRIRNDIASHLWQLYEIQMNRRVTPHWPENAILEVTKSDESLYNLIRYNLKPGLEYPWLTETQMWEVFHMGIDKFCEDCPREFYPIHDMTYALHEDHIYIVAETIDVNGRRYYLR